MKEAGYVYILTNPSFKEDWVKIGKSSRPVDIRSKELDNTAGPLPFEIYATLKTVKYSEAERLIHRYIERFTDLRIRDNREFFNVSPEDALAIFKDVAQLLDDAEIEEVYKSSMFSTGETPTSSHHKTVSSTTPPRKEMKKWMIPGNSKYFNVEGCFEKLGYVYWRQHFHFQTGDVIYIYMSSPESAVRFKCMVEGHDLPYTSEQDVELEFYANPKDSEVAKQHNRYVKLRLLASSQSDKMKMTHLLEHGMNWAPQGCLNLSHSTYAELLTYIESNF
ncbi:MAG: GIY-YIG nuclease family protein [Alistipes sp.]|nr:GIY-YIG nuclease family protein [Alistipes sp.]